ncbi:MAG: nucleoside/nucleotide kinase family protein [Alphaproteobacteria bacterium]|nr:nucleoside/nucleotide kinase family protein [Alphaproteobacteria bacterium]
MKTISIDGLVGELKDSQGRLIVAVAGAPASGKSTVAERLVEQLNEYKAGLAAAAPMDGFHLDDGLLKAKGIFDVKGAPDTFDIGGFKSLVERLSRNEEAEINVPLFDRDLEISRAGARSIGKDVKIVVIEGNYLLLDKLPWTDIRPFYDMTVFIDVPRDVLKQRLIQRWQSYDYTPDMIEKKLNVTDMPNVELVVTQSLHADFMIENNQKPRQIN